MTPEPGVLPITEAQQGLLVVDGWVGPREIYNQVMRFEIDPALSPDAVRRAVADLVTAQPALRQVFGRLPDAHARLAPPPRDLPLERVEVPPAEFERAADDFAARLGRQPFDLHTGPAYRFGYLRASDGSGAALLFCGHHIIGDGISMGPIIRDLEASLAGSLDVPERLREREKALRKEVEAQNAAAGAEDAVRRGKAWARELRDVPPLVLAPRPDRPLETSFVGARRSWLLTGEESAALRDCCKRLSITPFVLFMGVYGAVLARHGGVSRVLVGSPFSARRTIGSFDLCGFFVNTLPVTVDVEWTRTVDEHLGEVVRAAVDHCRSNVDVPFNRLVAEAAQERVGNRNPLFSAMLAMQDTFDGRSTGAVRGVREPANGTAKFDLWLGATAVDGRWLLELEHDVEVLPPTVVDGLLDSLRTALRRALADGSRPLADLFEDAPPITGPATAEPGAPTLAEWIASTARRTPDAVAVEEPGRRTTYRELLTDADAAAAGLVRHGVVAGDVVGLAVTGLREAVTAILAVLRAGATYLPLDPALPAERLTAMARVSRCRLVVGAGVELPEVPTLELPGLSGVADASGGPSGDAAVAGGDPSVAPYLMFTSGSSGTPKGVLMGHGPLLNLAAWQIAALGHDAGTRFLQYAPLGFDVSFQEILPTLAAGGTVVTREPADRRDFAAVARRVADTAVTHVFLPVAALRPFVRAGRDTRITFPALRQVCVSGEQLVVDDTVRQFFADHPGCTLVNLYGPTETNAATVHTLSGRDAEWPAHVPIGRPLPGVVAYVVDETGHLAPAGVAGELHLGGIAPADGYVGEPERTAAGFLPDRFAGTGRMYRTGDQVVLDERGRLLFLGRRDTQVKIRGHRVELGEIESVANAVAGVRQAVAVARGAGADRELVLFLVADGTTPDHDVVSARLAKALPAYMVPARIFDLERVPTSGTGKTDRTALAAVADRLAAERRDVTTTERYADELEHQLARMWSDVLGTGALPRDRSLLACGAHSLNVVAVFARIDERYGVTIGVSDFFRAPTIAALADLVRAGRRSQGASGRLITLVRRGDRPSCLMLPGAGGGLNSYLRLAAHLGETHNVHAVQPAGLAAGEEPDRTLARMATSVLDALGDMVPSVVFGWSLGGVLAWEVCLRLAERGHRPDLVVVDGFPFPEASSAQDNAWIEEQIVGRLGPHPDPALAGRVLRLFRAQVAALDAYRPQGVYHGRALLRMCAPREPEMTARAVRTWGELTPGAVVGHLDASHFEVFDPPRLPQLVDALDGFLGRAVAR